jgi:hypothetical protein
MAVLPPDIIALNTRLPCDLHRELAREATREHRSLNSQIVALLERGLRGKRARAQAAERRAQVRANARYGGEVA